MDNWMSNLPDRLLDLPLTKLSIPGSHNSCSFSITNTSPLSSDNEAYNMLKMLGDLGLEISSRWAKTQDGNVAEQLNVGLRYFDLRVLRRREDGVIYFVHGQYAQEISLDLSSIRLFLRTHPHEVVLLDFNHFYQFDLPEHFKEFEETVTMIFKPILETPAEKIPTLRQMRDRGHQMICFLQAPITSTDIFWPSSRIRAPWPNTTDPENLIEFLDRNQPSEPSVFHVTQGILTPSVTYILQHLTDGLDSLASPAGRRVLQWLKDGHSAPRNIVIIDFAVRLFENFAKCVIDLNAEEHCS